MSSWLRRRIDPEWIIGVPFTHRGLFSTVEHTPENSMKAFSAAVAEGFGIELDVKLSADGEVMVFHDDTLERLCDQQGRLGRTSYADLQKFRLQGTSERIPRLTDVLDLVDGRVPLLIELKSFDDEWGFPSDFALEDSVIALVRNYPGPLALQSFNPRTVAYLAQKAAAWPLGLIACDYRRHAGDLAFIPKWRRFLYSQCGHAWFLQPDYLVYDFKDLPLWGLRLARRRFPLLVWGINSIESMENSRRVADNIIFENIAPAEFTHYRSNSRC